MKGTKRILLLFNLIWMLTGFLTNSGFAQSSELQLNLLLEPSQVLDWTKEFSVAIAEQIPATIILGKLKNENSVIGILRTEGLGHRLVLHGIEDDNTFNLHEWIDNNTRSGTLILEQSRDSISGFWYNQDNTIRLSIRTENLNRPYAIRQYQHDQQIFHTRYSDDSEELIDGSIIRNKEWKNRPQRHQRCYSLPTNNRITEFCRTGSLDMYMYNRITMVRLLHGLVPQIPHDEVFNSHISAWLDEWENQIFQDSITDLEEQRWSDNQTIWFIPDFITDNLVSGLLSIQFSGDNPIHSRTVIYDKQKKIFYKPDDFFRSHTSWGDDFQKTAYKMIYEKHASTIDVFPEIIDRIQFHMTLNPKGILISSDYTPYFGRLEVQLEPKDYQDDLQKFAPFRKLIIP